MDLCVFLILRQDKNPVWSNKIPTGPASYLRGYSGMPIIYALIENS